MNEAYVSLGPTAMIAPAIAAVVMVIFAEVARRRKGSVASGTPLLALAITTVACALIPAPFALQLALPLFAVAFTLRHLPAKTRFGVAGIGLFLGGSLIAVVQAFPSRLELKSDTLAFVEGDRRGEVSRDGLEVHAITSRSWMELRGSGSWTTYSKELRESESADLDDLGPSINGSFVYCGPRPPPGRLGRH